MRTRLRQTYLHLRSRSQTPPAPELTDAQRRVVVAMSAPDQRHALATYARLRALGADAELRAVGLLHDVGKPRDTRLWQRVLAVLAPGLARRIGGATLRAYLDHAHLGADAVRTLGMSERAVRLVLRHHEPPADDDERLLARADRDA